MEEQKREHLYTTIKVARDEDLAQQIGREIYFDLVDFDKVRSFRVPSQMTVNLFKEEVAKEFGVPVEFQRLWLWAKRQNDTYRPARPLTHLEGEGAVRKLRKGPYKGCNSELNLFLEVQLGLDLLPISPPIKAEDDILLFFKFYDSMKEELCYIGRLLVKVTATPSEILAKLNEMAGFTPDEEVELYEEIRFEPHLMCDRIDKELTFRASQLADGDIVCFQKSCSADNCQLYCRYPDVPSFLEYILCRQIVHFRSLEKPNDDNFCLEMSKLNTYDEVVERVAQELDLNDPSKIRLTSHNCYSQQPEPRAVKYRGVENLSDMLSKDNQAFDILYYEVLDIPLPEMECLKTLKVAFYHATRGEVTIHTIRLPKQSTVSDIFDDLKTKVELSHPYAELRLLEVFYNKIYKIFPASEKIQNINQYRTLRAEEIPKEEKHLGPHGHPIHVYHFTKATIHNQMQIQNFGEPFLLVIHAGETLAEVKDRIQLKLRVSDVEFAKWKFAVVILGRPEYLEDTDILFSRLQRWTVYHPWEVYLGLQHADNAPRRFDALHSGRLASRSHEGSLIEEMGSSDQSPSNSEGTLDSTQLAKLERLLESDSDSVKEIIWEEPALATNSQLKLVDDLDKAEAVIKEAISLPMKEGLLSDKSSQLILAAQLVVSRQPKLANCLKTLCDGSLKSRLQFSEHLFATSEAGLLRLQETTEKANDARAKYKVARDSDVAASVEGAELQNLIDSTEEEIHQLKEKLSGLKKKKLQADDRASHFKQQLSSLGNNVVSTVTVLTELQKNRSLWVAQKAMAEREFTQLLAEWDQLRKAFL